MRDLNEKDLEWLEETMNEWDAFEEAPVGCCGKDKMTEKEMEKERDAFMLFINEQMIGVCAMKKVICEKSYRDGNLILECYYKDETKQELHREDGPAKIMYYINGNVEREEYYKNGVLHREDGPAKIIYYGNGNIDTEEYYKDGVLHREDEPALIWYNKDGGENHVEYYINGVFIPGIILRNQGCV